MRLRHSLLRNSKLALLALGASLLVACAPEDETATAPVEAPLNNSECTGSKVRPIVTFNGNYQERDFAEDGAPGRNPWWLPSDMTRQYNQTGCSHAAVFDVRNFAAKGSQLLRSNPRVITDWKGHGTVLDWSDDENQRLRMLVYVWRKWGDGSWTYVGRVESIGHQGDHFKWYPPKVLLFGDGLEALPSNRSVAVLDNLVTGAYYRFAVSLRLYAGIDDRTDYVEEGFNIANYTGEDII